MNNHIVLLSLISEIIDIAFKGIKKKKNGKAKKKKSKSGSEQHKEKKLAEISPKSCLPQVSSDSQPAKAMASDEAKRKMQCDLCKLSYTSHKVCTMQ